MRSEYVSLTFRTTGYNHEILMAILGELPFEAFQEESDEIIAYVLKENITESFLDKIHQAEGQWFESFQMDVIPDKNWNEVWESSFDPISINEYCHIRASFHEAPTESYKHQIVIAPKMAFGTGHHETTYMMMEAMSKIDFKEKSVFDFGCGTGILSVLAAKEGASRVFGIDIQPEAKENSYDHARLNEVNDQCSFEEGGLEKAAGQTFDVILANINLNVIVDSIEQLKSMLNPGGIILISGIMIQDKDKMKSRISFHPLSVKESREKGEWLQMTIG